MIQTFVDSALEELSWTKSIPASNLGEQIKNLELELRFLKMFHWCFAMWDHEVIDMTMRSVMADTEVALKEAGRGLYSAALLAVHKRKFKDWNQVSSKLFETILQIKPHVKDICLGLLASSWQCKFPESSEIVEFLDAILMNLMDLVSSRSQLSEPMTKQIEALEKKLRFFRKMVDFTAERCVSLDEVWEFRLHVQAWANSASCLLFLYWTRETEEETARMDRMLFALLQKIKPCTPKITRMYFGVMTASKSSRSDTRLVGEIVATFVDFLLENIAIPAKDVINILREGLIFFIAFLMDSPEDIVEDWKLIQIQKRINVLLNKAVNLICSFCNMDEMRADSTEEGKSILSGFLKRTNIIMAEVRELCVPKFPSSNFPTTNGLGFLDLLLENLENLKEIQVRSTNLAPFAKHQIFVIHDTIKSVRPFLKDILDLKNEDGQVECLQRQIINMAYKAEHAINSSVVREGPVWYNMIYLSYVIKETNHVKDKINEIKCKDVQNTEFINSEVKAIPVRAQAQDLRKGEIVVGLSEEAEAIINLLKGGSSKLDIVSIVGMPGLGKTTLAKKVYNDPSVRYHFNKQAFCIVSQAYGSQKLLLDILRDLINVDDDIGKMKEEELAELLYKCLKGQRYLIVMDDIWDIKAWGKIRISFPDDDIGSRVMFTTRIGKVALEAKSDSSIFPLRLLSHEESWELLQKKIFSANGCPSDYLEVGKQIAENCKGLPLAVVVIAGLLARTPMSLKWWKEISDTMATYLSTEGCTEILELSYKHLPEHMKSCFLYLGAFVEDKEIRVRKLASLWMAEGFLQKSKMKSSKDVARECLNDLIDRSLVIAARRSSDGGIKTCRIHDLLRDLCIAIAKEDNFLKQVKEYDVFGDSSSPSKRYDQYRLSIQTKWTSFVYSKPRCSSVHTLLCFPGNDSSWNPHPYNVPSFLGSFKLLQVLDLEEVRSESFPKDITLLLLLRYLAVTGKLQYVPSSIANLWNLETFILKTLGAYIPRSIWKMQRLRHVDVGRDAIIDYGYSRLDNVETFSSPTLSSGKDGEEILRRIPNVRKLSCLFVGSWDRRNKCNRLPELDCLSNLESLNVIYRGRALQPYAYKFPSTLKKLTLSEFNFKWSEMSNMIVKLPNLEVLKLLSDAFLGETWTLEDEFLKLKYLEFQDLNLVHWNAHADSFPCLERLVLIGCDRLEEIPPSFSDISTLKAIEVYRCEHTVQISAFQIQEQQLDLGNEGFQVFTH